MKTLFNMEFEHICKSTEEKSQSTMVALDIEKETSEDESDKEDSEEQDKYDAFDLDD